MIPWTRLDQALSESPRLLGAYVVLAFMIGLMIGFMPWLAVAYAVAGGMWFVFPLIGRLVMLTRRSTQ